MRMTATARYDRLWLSVSVLVAIGAALWWVRTRRRRE